MLSKDVRKSYFNEAYWFLTLLRQAGITVDVFSVGERAWDLAFPDSIPGKNVQHGVRALNAWRPYEQGLDAPKDASWIDVYKKVLAVESGGLVLDDESDVAQQMAECVRGADIYYTLTFDPPLASRADEYHRLEIKVQTAGLTAETVRGYFDEPFYNDAPNGGARGVTADELVTLLRGAKGGQQEQLLMRVALMERLTHAERTELRKLARGGKAREALEMVADSAEFKPPPKSEIVPAPPLNSVDEQKLLDRARAYLEQTIPRLPDFLAIRKMEIFNSTAGYQEASTTIAAVPLHRTQRSQAQVVYRRGMEQVNGQTKAEQEEHTSLNTYGTFGPLLKTIRGTLGYAIGISWSRWERGPTGKDAVFAFAVPENNGPHDFAVAGCCVLDRAGNPPFRYFPGYHGTITIDPATGAILRFQLQADLTGFVPIESSNVMVEYVPLTLGSHTYFVPRRSVTLWRGRAQPTVAHWNLNFRTWGPEETRMNRFTFDRYHMFHGTMRILTGVESVGNSSPRQ